MFRKKKLYKIVYQKLCRYSMIIEAKDEFQAIRKFRRKMERECAYQYTIISFEEYTMGRQQ